jgi:hypothetical protein
MSLLNGLDQFQTIRLYLESRQFRYQQALAANPLPRFDINSLRTGFVPRPGIGRRPE